MKKRTSSLPVLVVVAVVALVLGSIGTAVAGPAITKKKVKAIATKVVKKQAPTLAVASAANAANAANADKVDGLDASSLARATGASDNANFGSFDSGTYLNVLSKPITVPVAGILVITGTTDYNQSAGNVNPASLELRVALDGNAASPDFAGFDESASSVNSSGSANGTIAVTAGTHTVSLQVRDSTTGAIFVGSRSISVVFVPFGGTGVAGTIGKAAPGASGGNNQ